MVLLIFRSLVDKTYSIFVSRTFVLAFVSNELLSKRSVFIKTGSDKSRRLLSIFSIVSMRARLLVIYVGQPVDSVRS